MTFLEQAHRYFTERGVLEETVRDFQIETVEAPTHDQLVGWLGSNSHLLEAAIVFPNLVPNPDDFSIGIHNHYVRCFPPPVWDGKEHKFLCTQHTAYRPYILPPVCDVAYEINQPIYVVEKQTAALLLHQNGFHAIAFDGTWGAAAKKVEGEKVEFHPVLAEFHWTGRPVYLCFDRDFRSKQNVLWGLIRAYILFSIAGAVVRLIQWDPPYTGLEDFVAAKAGLDLSKQRSEIDSLTATVSGLSANKAAGKWIIPQYRSLFEREIAAIVPGMAERSMLADCLHDALGTTAGDLKKSWGTGVNNSEANKKGDELEEYFNSILPWPVPVPLSEILSETLAKVGKYNFTQDFYKVVTTGWTGVTYVFEESPFLPLLIFSSPKEESGKTSHMTTLVWLVYRPIGSSLISAAGAHRWLEQYKGTIWVDEVKTLAENPIMVALLNLGFNNSGHIVDTPVIRRWDPETRATIQFRVNFMKMMAGIGSFLTEDTVSRSLIIPMERALPHELATIEDYAFIVPDEFLEIVRMWHGWRTKALGSFRAETLKTMRVMPSDIRGRKKQKFAPLFTLFRLAGDQWYQLMEYSARKMLTGNPASVSETLNWQLLRDAYFVAERELGLKVAGKPSRILTAGKTGRDFLPTKEFIKTLHALPEGPWRTCGKLRKLLDENFFYYLLRDYDLKSETLNQRPRGGVHSGLYLDKLFPIFERYRTSADKSPFGDSEPPDDDDPGPSCGSGPAPVEPPESGQKSPEEEKSGGSGVNSPCRPVVDSQVVEYTDVSTTGVGSAYSENADHPLSCHTAKNQGVTTLRQDDRGYLPHSHEKIPPSTPQASFCAPSHPERLLFLDIETFYPCGGNHPQPATYTAGQLATRRRERKAHPWASDPRRCAMRFLTIHDTEGTFGAEPLTIDFQANPELPENVLKALSTRALVGHNLDFDLTVLRRYGIQVSSSIVDTMIASRLLGLGKEKPKFDQAAAYDDLSLDEIEELASDGENDPNPVDHDLAATVRRYTGIEMEKARTHLGASDWACHEITPEQRTYMLQDVVVLPRLWETMKPEIRGAGLEKVFEARMEFFPHLNQVKMTGMPVDGLDLETDLQRVSEEKDHKAEELSMMFSDLESTFEIPKSRKKKIKIKNEKGKTKFITGPTHEGFHASHRNQHWIPALATRGIFVENTQEPTLRRLDKPECLALLKYASASKRLSEIKGIARSLFSDGRVRAENWNQLSARTGRMTSTRPNLQQVPRDWRTGFRVDPPQIWLKGDLSQIEMLIIAITTGDQNMIDMIRGGKDIYVEYGARIFGKKPERGPGEDQITDQLREVAKKPTLGIFYGLTPWGFVRAVREKLDLEYSIEQAEDFFRQYFEMFPGVKAYYDVAEENAYHQETVHTIAGTRRFLPPLIGEPSDDWEQNKTFRKSWAYRRNILLNSPIQGSGADLVIWAVNQFMPELTEGVEIVNLVHDEVDAIVTRETLRPTVETITRAFQETFARFYPASTIRPKIKFSAGPSWGEVEELP